MSSTHLRASRLAGVSHVPTHARPQAKRDIEVKKQELGQARIERQHLEEYEVSCGHMS
jgi:hypothetical protein